MLRVNSIHKISQPEKKLLQFWNMCIYVQNACIENEGNDKWASLCICSVITLCCYAYKLFILGMQMHFHAKCYLRNVNFWMQISNQHTIYYASHMPYTILGMAILNSKFLNVKLSQIWSDNLKISWHYHTTGLYSAVRMVKFCT